MSLLHSSYEHSLPAIDLGSEANVLKHLINATMRRGIAVNAPSLTGCYVTLKSFTSILLVGPAQNGKLALVEALAEILTDDAPRRYQTLVGHARWASRSKNVSLFVEAQRSLNGHTLAYIIDEAMRPENANRLFIACLARISPVELYDFFTVPGPLGLENARPVPLPANFRLIGTMDTEYFRWGDPELLLNTAVVSWPSRFRSPAQLSSSFPVGPRPKNADRRLLQASVRHEGLAFSRLGRLLDHQQPFRVLIEIVTMLRDGGVAIPREALNQAIIFLANSWSGEGKGLFASSSPVNLTVALDLAVAQHILPWAATVKPANSRLYKQLEQLLHGRFHHAAAALQSSIGAAQ